MLEHTVFFPLYSTHPSIFPFILHIIGYTYIYILSSIIDYHFVRCNLIFSQYSYVSSRIYTRCLYAYMNIYIYICERVCFRSATVLKPWYVNESFAYETRNRVSSLFFVILSLKESWCFFLFRTASIVRLKYREISKQYREISERYWEISEPVAREPQPLTL